MAWVDMIGVTILAAGTIGVLVLVPEAAWTDLAAPETRAIYAFLLTLIALAYFRRADRRRLEQIWLAVFLAGMPLIYVESGLRHNGPLAPELIGFVVFFAVASAGIWASPWLLVAGIIGHGLLWDLWHLDREGTVPGWYAIGCALIDVSLGAYYAGRLAAQRVPLNANPPPPPGIAKG